MASAARPPVPATPAAAAAPTARSGAGSGSAGGKTLMVIAFVLLSRVLGVVRNMVIARVFGQNATTDIYIRAFAVPDLLYLMLAGGALSTVFIPVFTKYVEDGDDEEAWRTFGYVVTLVAVATAGIILFAEALAYPLARMVAPRFGPEAIERMVPLTRILLPAQWFFFVGGLFMATLQARGRFLIPSLGPIVYNLGIVAGALFFGPRYGPAAMTWGALIGAALGNFLLPYWDLRAHTGARWPLGLRLDHPGVRRFGVLLLPAMLGLGLSQLGFLITGFFLGEGGELSALKNGYDLTQAPIGIFAQASAIVLFPTLSALAARGDMPAFRSALHHGIRRILFLTVPVSLLMAVLAEPIIVLLYAGPKFGPAEVDAAALSLRLYSVGTFAWSAQAVLGRGFFAMQDTRTPLSITKYMIVAFAVLCSLSMFVLRAGYAGLAATMSLIATLNAALFLATLQKRVGGLNLRALGGSAARILLASGAAAAAAWGVSFWLGRTFEPSGATALATLLAAGGAGVAMYGGIAYALRFPELRTIKEMFRRGPAPKDAAPPAS